MTDKEKASPKRKRNPNKVKSKKSSKAKKICSNPKIKKALTREQLNEVVELGKFQCSKEEIGYALGLSRTSIQKWTIVGDDLFYPEFVEALEKGKAMGRQLLRSKQVEVALDDKHRGQATMLIWTGKQLLGQREVKALEVTKMNDDLDILLDEASAELHEKPGKGKK